MSQLTEEPEVGLQLMLHRGWLSDSQEWWETIMREARWYRVRYKSHRFGNNCVTPCWTTFYGGLDHFSPFTPVPAWLQPLVSQVSARCGGAPFNAMLLRLYIDGNDRRGPRH